MPLTNNIVTVFSVVRETTPGSGVYTKIAEQDNLPTLIEDSAPSAGHSWSWTVDDDGAVTGGFIGSPAVTVTPTGGDGRIARIGWSGIVAGDWRNGVEGTFVVRLSDGAGLNRGPYTITLKTRAIEHIDFTVLQGQTSAGSNPVCGAAAGETHVWTASDTPAGVAVTFTADGRISVTYAGDWSAVNGTFTLSLGNGAGKPESTFDGTRGGSASLPSLKMRRLLGDGYTVIKDQTSGGAAISGPSTETYTFTPSALPAGCTLTLSNRGAVTGATSPNWGGASDGVFNLEVKDGTRPSSYFTGTRHINFRALIGDGYTYIRGQASCGPGINAAGVSGFVFTVTDIGGGASLTLDNMGRITSILGALDTTFDLEITDGSRPSSLFTARALEFRTLSKIRVPYSGAACSVKVQGEAGNRWDWQSFTETLPVTQLTSTTGSSTSGMTLTPTLLEHGERGTATVRLQKQDASSNPRRPYSVVSVPISTDLGVKKKNSADSHTLPGGRGRMRYQAELEAVTSAEAGMELVWSVDFSGGAPDLASVLSLAPSTGASCFNMLETPYDSGTGTSTYLPNTTATRTFPVTVVKRDSVTLEEWATSDPVDFDLSIVDSKDDLNVTVLLDRSGSMSLQHRWEAACSAAGLFSTLVRDGVSQSGRSHKLGVYWFNSGATPAAAFHNSAGNSYSINGGAALDSGEDVAATCAASSPTNCTALGAGLLLCRDEQAAAYTGNEEKVLLALSDGMENQLPNTTTVFFDSGSSDYWGSPNVRIYSLALMTAETWVERLRGIVAATGGLSALDVMSIPTWTADTPHKINNWFMTMFCELFGYTPIVTPPDPAVTRGKTASQPVHVNLGQTKLVFFVTHDEPRPEDWRFDLKLPLGAATITKETAKSTNGIRYFETRMSKMYIVDFPLRLAGFEQCWAGVWNMEMKRLGDGIGHFGAGAIAAQDVTVDVTVLSKSTPCPGDTVTLSAAVTDASGNSVTNANAKATITPPGPWSGDRLTAAAKKAPELYRKLDRSKSIANRDIDNPTDKLWQHVLETQKPKSIEPFNLTLKHKGNGIYTASFKVTDPGEYTIDVTCQGGRTLKEEELANKRLQVLDACDATLRTRVESLRQPEIDAYLKRAADLFAKSASLNERFRAEARRTLKVRFVPDLEQSICFGYLEDLTTLCLHVEPKDRAGRLLGPGWAESISFITPIGSGNGYPAKDMLDGTYEVEVRTETSNLCINTAGTMVTGSGLALIDRKGNSVSVKNGRLSLADGFQVDVLGTKMPITVFALAGNKHTKETHFVTCKQVSKIKDEHFEWFRDLRDIKASGFDTCEICMPLVGDTRTMEVHKPLCAYAAKIKAIHRKEIHSVSAAKKQGFDGCRYCLSSRHTK